LALTFYLPQYLRLSSKIIEYRTTGTLSSFPLFTYWRFHLDVLFRVEVTLKFLLSVFT